MTKEQIKRALAYAGMTQAEGAQAIGISPQNFNNKLARMSFTAEQLEALAQAMGAEIVPASFDFGDGVRI